MNKGFTLMEVLMVVMIIGILSAIALPNYTKAVKRARMMEAVHNLSSIQRGIDMNRLQYKGVNQTFLTEGGTKLDVDLAGSLNCDEDGCSTASYVYTASCQGSRCDIQAEPLNASADLPILSASRTASGMTATWSKLCAGGAKGLCEGLRKDGGFSSVSGPTIIKPPVTITPDTGRTIVGPRIVPGTSLIDRDRKTGTIIDRRKK